MISSLFQRSPQAAVAWNLLLLTAGAAFYAFGINALAVPHKFVSGGVFGLSLLAYYTTGLLSPAIWNVLLNLPIFLFGLFFVSRRFFFYSVYGVFIVSLFVQLMHVSLPVHDDMLAAVTGGALCGAGVGIMLRSLGSSGGLDIIAVYLHQRFNIRIGQFIFLFNLGLFSLSFYSLGLERVLFSLVMTFILGNVADHFISLFNQRKMVIVVSDRAQEIADSVLERIHRGATFLSGRGAYSKESKEVLMTVVNNLQLKRLEETVFSIDPQAFMIIENTFNVLGTGFSRRKVY